MIVGHYLLRDDVVGRQHRPVITFAVDQLEDANDLIAVRSHRDHEHRLRSIAELLVECAILPVGDVVGEEVDVLDHQRLAGGGGVAGETRVIDGNGELGEGQLLERIVLREAEAQRRRRVTILGALDEIERRGIARRNASRLRQNHLEQGEQIALGGEGDADARQLGELAMAQRAFLVRDVRADETYRVAKGSAQEYVNGGGRRVGGDVAGQEISGKFRRRFHFAGIAESNERRNSGQFRHAATVVFAAPEEPAIEQDHGRPRRVHVRGAGQTGDAAHLDRAVVVA